MLNDEGGAGGGTPAGGDVSLFIAVGCIFILAKELGKNKKEQGGKSSVLQ